MTDARKVRLPAALAVPIVADGAIAGHPVGDGRLLPLLILDTSARPEVSELLRVHRYLPPGDHRFQWAISRDSDDEVALYMRFLQPIDLELLMRFSIERQAILVEGMLSGGGVWLQDGRPGDRLATTMDAERVLVELPDTGFRPAWEKALLARMTGVIAGRLATSRRKARPVATQAISQMQAIARFRLQDQPAANPD